MTPVLIRMPPELLAQIDAQRGDVPRAAWIRRACENAVAVGTAAKGPGWRTRIETVSREERLNTVQIAPSFGPVKPKPGARLKK